MHPTTLPGDSCTLIFTDDVRVFYDITAAKWVTTNINTKTKHYSRIDAIKQAYSNLNIQLPWN